MVAVVDYENAEQLREGFNTNGTYRTYAGTPHVGMVLFRCAPIDGGSTGNLRKS